MRMKSVVLVFIVLFLFIISCDRGTKTQKGVISGIITMEGQTDHSGITVMLFSANIIPDKLKEINNQYPQLAFPVEDKHIFDHREYSHLFTVLTSQDGFFSFPEVVYGKYIITYLKEGWGYNYLFDIELNAQEISLNNTQKADLLLYPETIVPVTIEGNYNFLQNHCYVVENDVTALPTSTLNFAQDAKILIAPSKKITIYGNCSFPEGDDFAYINSYSGIYSSTNTEILNGEGIVYLGVTETINNICIANQNTGISIRTNETTLHNLLVRDCVFGITSVQVNNLEISNSIIMDNKSQDAVAISNYTVNGCNVQDNIFYNNYISLKHEIVKNAVVSNNAFISGSREFINSWESTCEFSHNLVDNQGIGIENTGMSNLTISYNHLKAKKCIQTYHSNNWYNTVNNGWTKANNNDFIAEVYAIESIACYYYPDGPYPLDFKNNYWNTTSSVIIDELIVDFNDLGLIGGSGVTSIVNYVPYKNGPVAGAGIQ
jgi:hypothetical protein